MSQVFLYRTDWGLVWREVACNSPGFARAGQIILYRASGRCQQRPSSAGGDARALLFGHALRPWIYITSPRAEAPDFAKPTSRLAFWRHLPQHEGRHSFSDGGLGYSVRPLCGRKKTSKLHGRDGARPSRGKMVRNHHWILDQDLEGARSLGAALLDAGEDARFAF